MSKFNREINHNKPNDKNRERPPQRNKSPANIRAHNNNPLLLHLKEKKEAC